MPKFHLLKFKLSDAEILRRYEEFLSVIQTKLSNDIFSDRIEKINSLYDAYGDRLITTPASSFEHFHNCFPGGYVDHVLRVVDFAIKEMKIWAMQGLEVGNFTEEELIFAALHHDLGKLGHPSEDREVYIPNENEYMVKNRGQFYETNLNNNYSTVPDASLSILQLHGVQCTENEWYAIKLHDGLYDEANKPYFMGYSGARYRSNLPMILHIADNKAARWEFERWNRNKGIKA